MNEIYTIGHSNLQVEDFLSLLREHGITAVADVRSNPYSKFVPEYSQNNLKKLLEKEGIKYVFLGKELGGRTDNRACIDKNGKVVYELVSKEELFQTGVKRLLKGMEKFRIALMCTERDPLDCHRALFIGRHLHERGDIKVKVMHIIHHNKLETHEDWERRLVKKYIKKNIKHRKIGDIGNNWIKLLKYAYEWREKKVLARMRRSGSKSDEKNLFDLFD